MLATMRANSARPSPIPECSSACAGTLPTAPPALTLVYPDIVRCERVAVAAVVWNLDAGNLAATVIARERNDSRAISRNHAPATICNGCTRVQPNALIERIPSTALISAPSANEAPPLARLYPGTRRLRCDRSAAWSFPASLLTLVAGASKSPRRSVSEPDPQVTQLARTSAVDPKLPVVNGGYPEAKTTI